MKNTTLFKRAILVAAVVCLLSANLLPHGNDPKPEPNVEVAFVVNQFHNKTLADCLAMMDRLRPQAVTPQEKVILRADGFDLVNKTEIKDPALLQQLYRRTQKVLEFHHRTGIVEYLPFKNSDPVLITKPGAFIAISSRALEIAQDDDALNGIMAHELSHELVALQFLEAYKTHNCEKLRIIELLCDVFATITMIELNMNPDKFADALKDIVHNSKAAEELNDGTKGMPSLEARLRTISEIKKLFSH
jgi:Zn-dependent protease with chaperone function